MSNLPFLKSRAPAKLRKMSGISKYGFSENDELIESTLNELHQAIESKDHSKLASAIKALIDCVMAKEQGPDNEANEEA